MAGALLLGGLGVLAQRMGPVAPEWTAVLPAVRAIVGKEFPMPESQNPVKIWITADVTGDGTPEAVVDLGCCGAYTDEMTVMRMEDGKPVLALFRGRSGKVSTMTFLDGASVMHGAQVKLMSDKQAVFTANWDLSDDDKHVLSCTGAAYRWNAGTKSFDLSTQLSRSLSQDFCENLSRRMPR